MRKIFALVAVFCCTVFSAMAGTPLDDGVVITIGSTTIEKENMANVSDAVISMGKVSYDDATHTLTFDGLQIGDGQVAIDASALTTDNVTLEIKGTCFLTAKSKDAIHFKAGKGLTITGATGTALNVASENTGKSSALFLAKDHATADPNEFYPLSITGGLKLMVNNYFADAGYPAMACHHMDVDNSLVQLWGQDGEDNIQVFKGGKGLNNLHNNVMEYGDYGYGYVYYYPYTKKFPVWVDGWQMTDGLVYNATDGYYLLHSAVLSNVSGGVYYYPATRTVEFGSFTTISGVNPNADAVIRIYDEDSTDPIDIKLTSTTKLLSKKAGVAGLRIETESTFDIYGNNIEINTDATADAPALTVTAPLTFKNTKKDFDSRSVKIYSESDDGIYGVGTGAQITYDRCKGSIYGKLKVATGLESLTLNRAEYNKPDYKLYNNELCDGTTPLADKTVEININAWSLEVSASPAAGGTFTVTDALGDPLPNPYWYTETTSANLDASANAGYLFDTWRDIYGTELSNTTPYKIDLNKGSNATAVARFSRTVDTEADWYAMPEGSPTLYKFGAKFRGADVAAPTIPLPSGDYMRRAVYANGKIYYIAQNNSMDKTGMFSATFDGTTMGTQQTVIDFQNDYFPIYAIAYHYTDECFYAVACKTADYTYPLLKIDPNAVGDKITEMGDLGSSGSDIKSLTFTTTGEAYAIIGYNELYTLDLASGIPTLVGALDGLYFYSAESVGFAADPTTNELFVVSGNTMTGDLYRIDPATANYEFVSSHTPYMNASAIFSITEPVLGTMYNITVKSEDESKGTVIPAGVKKVLEGKPFTFEAKAKKHYEFAEWKEDHNTEAKRTITALADATFTASFKAIEGEEIYPIVVADEELFTGYTKLTSTELPAITNGYIEYDPKTNTLNLVDFKLSVTGTTVALKLGGEKAKGQDLIINVVGDCSIAAVADAIDVADFKSVTIKSADGAKLTVNSDANGIVLDGSNLTIDQTKVIVIASGKGISGSDTPTEELTILASAAEIKGAGGSICNLSYVYDKYVEYPSGYAFDEEKQWVKKGSAKATDNVVFKVYPKLTVKPVEKGSGHFTLESEDDSFVDVGYFKQNTEVTVTAVAEDGFVFARWMDDTHWKDPEHPDYMPEERPKPVKMPATDKDDLSALFYYQASSGSTWYAVNGDKLVSFSMSDYGAEVVNPKQAFSASGINAGDYMDGEWLLSKSTSVYRLEFEGFDKDTEIETNMSKLDKYTGVSGLTDMAYDLLGGEMYAVKGKTLYHLDGTKFDELATFKYKHGEDPEVDVAVTGIAVDASGTIYVLAQGSPEGVLYTVESIDEKKAMLAIVGDEKEGGKVGAKVTADAQAIAFDLASGELLWGAADYLRIISTDDAKSHIAGDLGQKEGTQGAVKALQRMSKRVSVSAKVAADCEEWGTVQVGSSKFGKKASADFIEGTNATVTAKAEEGYHFDHWMQLSGKNEKAFKGNENISITVSAGGQTYVAYFEEGAGIESITMDPAQSTQKILMDGVLYIMRDNRIYTVTGELVK